MMTLMKEFDFHKVIDNSVVSRLVRKASSRSCLAPASRPKQDRKARLAFK